MGRRAKEQSTWPLTVGCAVAGVAVVVVLLVPLDLALRVWIVRGLLVALVLGVAALVLVRGRVRPTRANRFERIAFQTVFFWAFFTALTFGIPGLGGGDPPRAVIGGLVAGALFGAGLLALDPWVVQRSETGERPSRGAG